MDKAIEALRVVICQKMGVCKYYGGRCNTTRCAVEPDVARAAYLETLRQIREPTHGMLVAGDENMGPMYGERDTGGEWVDHLTSPFRAMIDHLISEAGSE